MAEKPIEIVALLRDLVSRPASDMNRALGATVKELDTIDRESKKSSAGLNLLAKTATSSASAFGSVAKSLTTVVSALTSVRSILLGGAIIIGFQKFTEAFGETITQLDYLDKQSKRTGLGAVDLNRLQVAAKLAGVEAQQLSLGLGLLNRAAARIGTDKNIQQAFKLLNISVQDVRNARSVVDLLPRIADGLQSLSTSQSEDVLGTLFGKAGPQLTAFFEGGTEQFKRALAEVDAANVLFTRAQIENGARINDQLDLLSQAWQKVKADLLAAIGPSALALLDGFRQKLVEVPDKVRGLSQLVQQSFAEDDGVRQAARGALSQIGLAALDLLADSAIDIGSLLAQGFLSTVKVGIEALAPVFARLFDQSISPLIRKLPGLSDFSFTAQGRLQAVDEQIRASTGRDLFKDLDSARAEVARIQSEPAAAQGTGDFADLIGSGRSVRERVARERVALLEKQIAELDPSIRELKFLRAAAESQIKAENDQVDTDLRRAVAEGAQAIRQGADDLSTRFRLRLDRLFSLVPSVAQNPEREEQLAAAESQDQARRAANAQAAEARRVAAELDEARAKLEDQLLTLGAKAQAAKLTLDRQLAATFGTDGKDEALRIQQLERRRQIEQELGITFQFVASTLDKLEESERRRLSATVEAEELAKRATKIEQERARALQNIQAQQTSGLLSPDAARREQNAINSRFKQDAQDFGSSVDEFVARYPEFKDVTDRIIDQSSRLRSDAFNLRLDREGFGGGLADGFDAVINRFGDVADAGRQTGETIGNALTDGVASSLVQVVNGTASMAQAFRSLAVSVLNSLTQIILRLLIVKALSGIFGAAATPQPGDANFVGPLPEGFASGGLIGPGRSARDDTLIRAMRGEFVQPTRAVDTYGVDFMESVRRGLFPVGVARAYAPSTSSSEHIGSFMDGGSVGRGGAAGQQVLVIDERVGDQVFNGSGGAGLRWLEKNRAAAVGILFPNGVGR